MRWKGRTLHVPHVHEDRQAFKATELWLFELIMLWVRDAQLHAVAAQPPSAHLAFTNCNLVRRLVTTERLFQRLITPLSLVRAFNNHIKSLMH